VSARKKGRKRAIDALYAGELRGEDALALLAQTRHSVENHQNQDEIFEFADHLVQGVLTHKNEIDQILSNLSQNWDLERMPAVDRAILRLATFELAFDTQSPAAVVIAEAVDLSKELSTSDSPGFVNGILASVVATRKPI
jgi:N utilization substance protein B